ncbi:MAG TPA: pyridoxine 5'-phosphate synthase [Pyrinomonadaceae bacterium]|nr:pyridoxine 5'-phosphate synthase [Pyrinomonadaceae bacterium]
MTARLNINIDHVATVRQARRAPEPSVVAAAMLCEQAGADGITVHLRGDRRHIQTDDLFTLRRAVTTYLNVEMAATEEMMAVALDARPDAVTLVAERPDEITTEGGLDVAENFDTVRRSVDRLREAGLFASIFIDPEARQIEAARDAGAQQVELCTASYCDSTLGARAVHAEGRALAEGELARLREAAALAAQYGLHVAAGHGLTYRNVGAVASIREITEFNIGHNVIARAVLTGLAEAVREMRARIREAQQA